jgi:ADP-ribose pyrophosphatase
VKKPKTLHKGKRISLVSRGGYEYASRQKVTGIVAIVATTDDGKMLLVEQFRPPVAKRVIEIPAGLVGDEAGHEKEQLAAAAKRELLEETGYRAQRMTQVAVGPPSAGICDEVITIFLASGLKKVGEAEGDGSEEITVHEIEVEKVPAFLKRMSRAGRLIDLKVYGGLHLIQ